MLFTHRGFSGPAVLDLSHHVVMEMERSGNSIPKSSAAAGIKTTTLTAMINNTKKLKVASWLQGMSRNDWETLLSTASTTSGTLLLTTVLKRAGLPVRLADAICEEAGAPLDRKMSELRKAERLKLLETLCGYELVVTGHEGYPKAEVTGGGVPLEEIQCSTMESRIAECSGLYLAGEVVDVHGRIGGFNFFWAWVSGRLAGKSAAESL